MKGLCQIYTQPGWGIQYRYEEVEEFEPLPEEGDEQGTSEGEESRVRYREPRPMADGSLPIISEEPSGASVPLRRPSEKGDVEPEDGEAVPRGRMVRRTKKINVNVPPKAEHHAHTTHPSSTHRTSHTQ